jgi:hypothetical protein
MDYFAHPAISNSKLSWFKKSPAHFKYYQDTKTPDKPSYLIGSASHCILFEPDLFDKQYHVLDESKRPFPTENYLNRDNKKWKDQQYKDFGDKKIISTEEYTTIMQMMDQMHSNGFVKELLSDCVFEKEIYWIDPNTGLECKKKVDGEGTYHRLDYKTTDNADPLKWQKKSWPYEYYRQAGFYDLDYHKEFYFIVQEKTAPFAVSVHKCTNDLLNYGKEEAIALLRKIKIHFDYDLWPGYESKVFKPELDADDKGQNYFDLDIPNWVLQNM